MQPENWPWSFSIVEIFGDLQVSTFREVMKAKDILEKV